MLKRSLSIFLTALLILSSFTLPVTATNVEEVPFEVLAEETFLREQYPADMWNGSRYFYDGIYEVVTNEDETKTYTGVYAAGDNGEPVLTGSGFTSNWVIMNGDGTFGALTSSHAGVTLQCLDSTSNMPVIQLNGDNAPVVYRTLETPLNFDLARGGKYSFSLRAGTTSSDAWKTGRQSFTFRAGEDLSIGYDWNTEKVYAEDGETVLYDEYMSVTPFIEINGTKKLADNAVPLSGSSRTTAASVVLSAVIEVEGTGNDTVTLTVGDVTVSESAEITGAGEYIALDSKGAFVDDIYVKYADYSVLPEADDPAEDEEISALDEYAAEAFNTSEYVVADAWGNVQIDSAYGTGVTQTGTGWNGLWLGKDQTGELITSTDTAAVIRATASSSGDVGVCYFSDDQDATLYRRLASPIILENTTGKVAFTVDVRFAGQWTETTDTFEYIINDNFKAGYTLDADKNAVPYVTIGTTTVTAANKIALGYEALSKFKVIVDLKKNEPDTVTVRLSTNGENASVTATGDVIGNCTEIGIDGTYILFDNISIRGKEAVDLSIIDDYSNLTPGLIAEETFLSSQYSGNWGANINDVIQIEGSTGSGWNGNWYVKDSDDTDYRAPAAADNVVFTKVGGNEVIKTQNMPAGTKVYRLLDDAAVMKAVDGKYEFSVDVQNGYSEDKSNFRFDIGGLFSVGYDKNSKTHGTPVIEIDGETVAQADVIELGTGLPSSSSENIFYRIITEVYLNKSGLDLIKVSLYNRGSANTTEAEEPAIVMYANAELDGTVEYIALGSKTGEGSNYNVDNITVKGTELSLLEAYKTITSGAIAEETFLDSQYSGDWGKNINDVIQIEGSTGSGWNGNWYVKDSDDTDYRDPVADDKTVFYKIGGNALVKFDSMPAGTKAYRLIDTPAVLNDVDGKYEFTFDVQNGWSSDKSNVRFDVGGLFSVGYDKYSNTQGTPVIEIDGKTVVQSDKILELGTSNDVNTFYRFVTEVYLNKTGNDLIKVSLYNRGSVNTTNPEEAEVVMYTSAELDGTVEYIAFGSKTGEVSVYKVDNITISGVNITAAESAAAEYIAQLTGDYAGARKVDSIADGNVRALVNKEFAKYGVAYDNFDAYEASSIGSVEVLNRGAGWATGWTGDNAQITASASTSVSGYDLRGDSLNVSRKLANAIDLSVDGEYFVKTSAYVDATSTGGVNGNNFTVTLGDIKFGTQGVANMDVAEYNDAHCTVTPTFSATKDEAAAVVDNTKTYSGRRYNDYILHIISTKDGADTVEYYFDKDGVFGADDLVTSVTIESDDIIDTLTLTSAKPTRVAHIMADCWNDSVENKLSVYNDIPKGSVYAYYVDYAAAIADVQLPELVTSDYKLNTSDPYVGVQTTECKLEYSADGENYYTLSDLALLDNTDVRNVKMTAKWKNLGLQDDDEDEETDDEGNPETELDYGMFNLTTFSYEGKLLKVLRTAYNVPVGKTLNANFTYTFPEEDGWPAQINWARVQIKSYILGFKAYEPLDYAHTFTNSIYKEQLETLTLYVDPVEGTENGDGSEELPFATINDAKFYVRELHRDNAYPTDGVTVKIAAGDYFPSHFADENEHPEEYFWLQEEADYGLDGAPLVFEGEGNVRFIGGIKLDLADFEPVGAGDAVTTSGVLKYQAADGTFAISQLPVAGSQLPNISDIDTTPYFSVYFNEEQQTLARYPNEGYITVTEVSQESSIEDNLGFIFNSTELPAEKLASWWSDPIMAHGYWYTDFHDYKVPVTPVDNGLKSLHPAGENVYGVSVGPVKEGTENRPKYEARRFYIENSPHELDQPGEWYIDTEKDILYYYPKNGATTGEIIVSTSTDNLIEADKIENITLKNLTLIGGRNYGIDVDTCNNLVLDNITVIGAGRNGIDIHSATNTQVRNCEVKNTGAGGIIMVGGTRRVDTDGNNLPGNNLVYNCSIHDYAKNQKCYTYGIELGGYKNKVEHSEIYNAPHMAMFISGWDLEFRYNNVHHVVSEVSDMGAVYTGGGKSRRGNIIEHNYFHDLSTSSKIQDGVNYSTDISAVYMDDWSDGYTVRNNVFKNINGRAFRTNGGRDHTVEGNVFVNVLTNAFFTRNGDTRIDSILGEDIDIQNGQYKTFAEYPHLSILMEDDYKLPKYNVFKDNYTVGETTDLLLEGRSTKYENDDSYKTDPDAAAANLEQFAKDMVETWGCTLSASEEITDTTKIDANDYSDYEIDFSKIK